MLHQHETRKDRRRFIQGLGVAVLTVQGWPSLARTSDPPAEGNGAAANLIVHASPGLFEHTHELLIPYSVLRAPPLDGVKLESTRALLHTHDVALSREQLDVVRRGGAVTSTASSHTFVIALAANRPNEWRTTYGHRP